MIDFKSASPDHYQMLKDFARQNRKNMTDAEYALWQNIRGRRLGVQFLRQHIIGEYIVDFVCRENGLVIEVDGGYHSEPRQAEADIVRTQFLNRVGYKVIRFTNEEILLDIENVVDRIYKSINILKAPSTPPSDKLSETR